MHSNITKSKLDQAWGYSYIENPIMYLDYTQVMIGSEISNMSYKVDFAYVGKSSKCRLLRGFILV